MSGGLLLPGNLADTASASQQTFTGNVAAPAIVAGGLAGATQASRYAGAMASGAPVSGTFAVGDFVVDQTATVWVCTSAGTPGTWLNVASTRLALTGGTMSGAIAMGTNKITGVGAATVSTDAASLANRLDQFAAPTANISLNSQKITNLSNGGSSSDAAAFGQIPTTSSGLLPPGTILDYAAVSPPSGFLACDGSAVSRITYAALFATISTAWGAGDGSTTFNVPDLRGRVGVGVGSVGTNSQPTYALAATGGEQLHSLSTGELAAHTHNGPSHNHGGATGNQNALHTHGGTTGNDDNNNTTFGVAYFSNGFPHGPTTPGDNDLGAYSDGGRHSHNFTTGTESAYHTHSIGSDGTGATSSTGSGTGHNTMQPFAAVYKIIKT
jgi:microcystin-dependent protein